MRTSSWLAAASAACAVFATLSVRWFFPVCEFAGAMPMRCSLTATWVCGLSVVAALTGAAAVLSPPSRIERTACALLALVTAGIALVPYTVAPVCMRPEMACRTGSLPAIVIAGTVGSLLAISAFLVAWSRR